jgi:carbonic anhydrase
MALFRSGPCECCVEPRGLFERRRFLTGALAAGAAAAISPGLATAATGRYEALVLACIDPRFQEPVRNAMVARKFKGKYSQVALAGAGIGVVAPAFKDWHKTFWDNLGASVQLHSIKRVIVVNHRDCGAARIAYGEDRVKTRAAETETHRNALLDFRKQCNERHPNLAVELGLMGLDRKLERFA